MSEGLIAKRDMAQKSLDRWLLSRQHALGEEARRIAEDRITFWKGRITELDRLIREAAA